MEKQLTEFVKKWMDSQEEKNFFEPDKDGYVMFRRGALSINLPAYLEMILEDYLEEHAAVEGYIEWINRSIAELTKEHKLDAIKIIIKNMPTVCNKAAQQDLKQEPK